MKCFICSRRIWIFQRRTRATNPALRKILAIAGFLKEEDAGWMHSNCLMEVIYQDLDDVKTSLKAIESFLGFKTQEERKIVIEVRKGVVEEVKNLPEGWSFGVDYYDTF